MPGEMFRTPIEALPWRSQFEFPMKKADLKLLLEDYAGQLSPESIGPMERGRAAMLIARVLKLLVELELKWLK